MERQNERVAGRAGLYAGLALLGTAAGAVAQTPVAPPTPAAQAAAAPQAAATPSSTPVTLTVLDRQRVNATQWFAATPTDEVYGHLDSLLRIALAQRIRRWDWQAEVSQTVQVLPNDAVSAVAAQGQLGLGGTYYAANGNNQYPVAAFFKTGWARYRFHGEKNTLQVGRFEFLDGAETTPRLQTMQWVQTNRIAQRLLGNFGFSNAQRSLDGVQGKFGGKSWDLTAMAARADQGVFNMNGNPELNVDTQYLAYTNYLAKDRVQVRGFAIGYHDGRTGLTKTDNRALAVRQTDHKNIRIGTYGMSAQTALPVGKNTIDLMFWGSLQNGRWGVQEHRAGAVAAEGGFRANTVPTRPWLRGGMLRESGDSNPNDGTHGTFFQVLTTPRNYARFPFFNLENLSEQFVQLIDAPTKKVNVRTDLHFLQLTQGRDLWYQGGGAFDSKVFGYVGRPGNGHGSFATMYDVSVDYAVTDRLALTAYYSRVFGKTVVAAIYPRDRDAQYGFVELNYRFVHAIGRAPRP